MFTEYGTYKATVGPSRNGEYFQLNCHGMRSIAVNLRKQSLEDVSMELMGSGLIDPNIPLPE